jgi:hypothetical protein
MLNNEERKMKAHAASTLIKMTCLKDDVVLASMDIETGNINWEVLDSIERSNEEFVIYEVLKLILTSYSNLDLESILILENYDREAVLLALHTAFGLQQLNAELLN